MDRLNQMYLAILHGSGKPSEKFCALEYHFKQDKQHPGIIASISRSNMIPILLNLQKDNVITDDDLSEFSEEFENYV